MADNNKAVGPLAAAKLVTLIKAMTAKKYDKTGGKIEGSAEITGDVHAGGAVQSDLLLSAPSVTVHNGAGESVHINCSGDNAAGISSLGSDGKSHYSRLAVGTPTGDNDAATKAYVDGLAAAGYGVIIVTSTDVSDLGYDASEGAHKFAVTFDASFDSILANLAANKSMKFNITIPDNTGGFPLSFTTGYVSALGNSMYEFTGTLAGSPVVLSIGGLGSATVYIYADYLPEPNPDNSDDGKVLSVNKHKWEIKAIPVGSVTVDAAMSSTSANPVQNKVIKQYVDSKATGSGAVRYDATQELTFEQKQRARKNIEAADREWPTITGGVSLCPEKITDSNDAVHVTTAKASSDDFTVTLDCGPENALVRVKGIRTPTDADTDAAATVEYVKSTLLTGVATPTDNDLNAAANVEYVKAKIGGEVTVTTQNANLLDKSDTANQIAGKVFYVGSSSSSLIGIHSDTAIYFPVGKWGAGNYKFPIDYVQYGGSAAYNVALFNADKVYIKTKTSAAVDTSDSSAYILSLGITQTEIDSGAYYIGLSIRTAQLGTSAMVVKDIDYPAAYIEYGTTTSTYKAQKLENELAGKKAAFCGDSICAGTSVGTASSIYGQGWAGIIGVKNGMDWQNLGVNGATVAATSSSSGTLIVVNQLEQAYSDADYIILEGGCNDFDQMGGKTDATTMGEITAVWDDSYVKTTFAGALEHLFYTAVTKHPKAKIGYIIPQIMGRRNWTQYETISYRVYYNLAIDICKKWGIPYIDLWYESPLNPNLTVYYDPSLGASGNISDGTKCYVDGQHLTEAGYNLIAPKIEAWMRTL